MLISYFIGKSGSQSLGRGEVQIPYCLGSRVKFPQSVIIWEAMLSAGVLSSAMSAQPFTKKYTHPCANKLYADVDFIFQQPHRLISSIPHKQAVVHAKGALTTFVHIPYSTWT
ncbi:hypothetical protein ILYODFUR_007663 [Ilyodon furcidens]|uniref:Uncharacterized protein n=1 Tax=Ilyodon furcidens TaxID=33524 RepID=A0ABV0T649_9TELE